MLCRQCGESLQKGIAVCGSCGTVLPASTAGGSHSGGCVGYSDRIHDAAFARYLRNTNRWAGIFSILLATVAVTGFYLYGETSAEMGNPEALLIGIAIGGMFLLIGLYAVISRKRSRTWDGVVADRTIRQRNRRQSTGSGDDDYMVHNYTEYTVIVHEEDSGRAHRLTAEDDDTVFCYFQVGDRVRHHGGLNSYEKFDKSKDDIVFCNACATLCNITEDACWRCGCPLLK